MINDDFSATLAPLARADGSASFSSNGYSAIGAVNGPIDVQRKDELPEEAAVDVVIRPASGSGGIRERHLESIVQSTLRQIILVAAHPRTLIQVTLQIVNDPESESQLGGLPQSASNLPILPALLQTAMLALLTTSIPLSMALTSTLIAVDADDELISDPSSRQLGSATSVHVLAFSSLGDLLIVESEGDFSFSTWEKVHDKAKQVCCGHEDELGGSSNVDNDDVDMELRAEPSKSDMLRSIIQEQVRESQRWKPN